uniref:Cation/H+ exchanger transmembrane domain-containing protein n=1 Tax=Noctiluca scintillans TaxID=2966 RepID=A0A7S1AN24_NOCSC
MRLVGVALVCVTIAVWSTYTAPPKKVPKRKLSDLANALWSAEDALDVAEASTTDAEEDSGPNEIPGVEDVHAGDQVSGHDQLHHRHSFFDKLSELDASHFISSKFVGPSMGVFLLCVVLTSIASLCPVTQHLPESFIVVLVSLLLGTAARALMEKGLLDSDRLIVILSVFLNVFLLPIIIFNGGWTITRGDFIREFEPILIFALLGTAISTVVITSLVFFTAPYLDLEFTLREAAVFGALISAVDPVATLSSYGKLNIQEKQPLLNTIVFGESAINDAVAIVLFDVINMSTLDTLGAMQISFEVSKLLFISVAFGIFLAMGLVLMIRFSRLRRKELLLTLYCFTSAYFIFTLSEALYLSGIIATLFAGMVFNLYGGHHLTEHQKETASEFLETCAHFADDSVFMVCGAATALIDFEIGLSFPFAALLFCLVARALSVSVSSLFSNAFKCVFGDRRIITMKHQVMMWHGGLRGGIALVLALEIDKRWCERKPVLVQATFVVIVSLLLLAGSTTELALKVVGMQDARLCAEAHESGTRVRVLQRMLLAVHEGLFSVLVGRRKPVISLVHDKVADETSESDTLEKESVELTS